LYSLIINSALIEQACGVMRRGCSWAGTGARVTRRGIVGVADERAGAEELVDAADGEVEEGGGGLRGEGA
jgi:hypothetical protein